MLQTDELEQLKYTRNAVDNLKYTFFKIQKAQNAHLMT